MMRTKVYYVSLGNTKTWDSIKMADEMCLKRIKFDPKEFFE